MSPDDRRWLWLVYGTVFVPLVGQPLVVLASSVLYYRWRRGWPEAAVRLNVHAWIAVALNIGLTWAALRLVHGSPHG
jgi:hypothetical protein